MVVTDPEVLEADLEQIAIQAREWYEDSYTLHGLRAYVNRVLAVPRFAWGEFSWSEDWADKWELGAEPRRLEVTDARDHTGRIAVTLLKVASKLAGTDLELALNFDLKNPYVEPYVDATGEPKHTTRVGPGGEVPDISFKDGEVKPKFSGSSDSRLNALATLDNEYMVKDSGYNNSVMDDYTKDLTSGKNREVPPGSG